MTDTYCLVWRRKAKDDDILCFIVLRYLLFSCASASLHLYTTCHFAVDRGGRKEDLEFAYSENLICTLLATVQAHAVRVLPNSLHWCSGTRRLHWFMHFSKLPWPQVTGVTFPVCAGMVLSVVQMPPVPSSCTSHLSGPWWYVKCSVFLFFSHRFHSLCRNPRCYWFVY